MMFRLVNAGTGAVLSIRDVASAGTGLTWRWAPDGETGRLWSPDGEAGGRWAPDGGADGPWEPVDMGDGTQQIRAVAGGRLLGDAGPRTQSWWFVPDGRRGIEHVPTGLRLGGPDCLWEADYRVNGCFKLRNARTGLPLGRLWRLRYGGAGAFRIQNAATGRVLCVTRAERIVEAGDGGTPDRLWRFL